jgi:hypothetical protein
MGEPLSLEKLPGEVKMPLRITLTLTTRRGDVGSLDPLWQALLSPGMFEIARRQRASSRGKSFTILSDKADLSITFPHQQDPAKTIGLSCAIGCAVGFALFLLGVTPLWLVPVLGALAGLAGTLISRSILTETIVRGDLPDINAVSDALALWLSSKTGRKVHLDS